MTMLLILSLTFQVCGIGTYLPMKMEHTECSETLAYKIQMPENHPEESIHHSEHSKI